MSDTYILDEDGNPQPVADILEWGRWFQTAKRQVADTTTPLGTRVSTVFLGLDHRFMEGGPPLLWETMVFGGPLDGETTRYSMSADAKAGHEAMVAQVLAAESSES